MQSFVSAPQIPVAALKNPAIRGGPFINRDADRVPEIKSSQGLVDSGSEWLLSKTHLRLTIKWCARCHLSVSNRIEGDAFASFRMMRTGGSRSHSFPVGRRIP